MKINNIKTVLFVFFLIVQNFNTHAQTIEWNNSKWIWSSEVSSENNWAVYRKTIQLEDVSYKEAIANIAVDSKFWLYINGEMVVFEGGVARGPSQAGKWNRKEKITPANSWYETINMKPYLKKGKNTIAILAWYWGRETHKGTHIDSGKAGLLFSASIGNKTIVSDQSWKAKHHSGYASEDCVASKSLVQFSVKYNANNEFQDWTNKAWYTENYDDTNWNSAIVLANAGEAPWFNLVENYVPRLVNHGLKDYVNNNQLQLPYISKGETIVCKLPFNMQVTPYLEVDSEEGQIINITTDNRLNKIVAEYTTKSGEQSFESFSWMNGHEIKYTIPKGVTVKALKYRWMSVGEMAGDFLVNDPFYQRLWDMGKNTLFVCARDNFMDCPDRERALWIGDVADQAGYLFYTMDNAGRQLLKKSIYTTINFSEDGVLGALGPLRNRELVGQSLQFIAQTVWLYYLNTGDIKTLEDAYPYIKKYLSLFEMEANGLPKYRKRKSPDSWDWVDWGVKETVDKKLIQVAFYYLALEKSKEMAKVLDKNEDVNWYKTRLKSIKANFDKVFWKDGFYSSNPLKFKDDRANGISILSGVANEKYYDEIIKNVLIPNRFSSPHFEWMVEEAMCVAGNYKAALSRMKDQYKGQVNNKKISTLYEMFPRGGSYNHAWNASNTVLSKHIAGIQPTKTAWSAFEILPNLEHLKSLSQLIPTVKGVIKVDIKKGENSFNINLNTPKETQAIIGIPKRDKKISKITLNGEIIWKKGKAKKNKNVTLVFQDDKYIKVKVSSGAYQVEAIYLN